jgi:hypothetical protein
LQLLRVPGIVPGEGEDGSEDEWQECGNGDELRVKESWENSRQKLRGRFWRPLFPSALEQLSAFSFLPFSWLPWFYSPFPFFMDKSATNVLLQLFDCIELMKNEVKKKMNEVYERCCTKVTARRE